MSMPHNIFCKDNFFYGKEQASTAAKEHAPMANQSKPFDEYLNIQDDFKTPYVAVDFCSLC